MDDPGSNADVSRRLERVEQNHEALARDVSSLTGTMGRLELNQTHAEELNKLRFKSLDEAVAANGAKLDVSVGALTAKLDAFVARIEAIMTGEADTAQSREGRALVDDYKAWRKATDERLDDQDVRNGQLSLLAKLAVMLIGGNLLSIIVAVGALVAAQSH